MSVPVQPELKFEFRACGAGDIDPVPGSLLQNEVHVWRASLPASPSDLPRFLQLLSDDEKERAQGFRFDRIRNDFIFTRGMLRTLLGCYLALPPADLRFAYARHGKPFLASPHTLAIAFNLSHTDGMAIFAFARDRRLGIDVEKLRKNFDVEPIAERFFSLAEWTALRQLPGELRCEAFFRCWTRKEAYIKAHGEGLSHPLHQFDVSVLPGEPAALLSTRPDSMEARRWWLQDVPSTSGHVAAVAVEVSPSPAG
jgi:4'-phosphopantetheinyl transferase